MSRNRVQQRQKNLMNLLRKSPLQKKLKAEHFPFYLLKT
jgi:hypothetical protein